MQVSTAITDGMKLHYFHESRASVYLVDSLTMLLSSQMINDDLAGMENIYLSFSQTLTPKTSQTSRAILPFIIGQRCSVPLVVRGLLALWLWCPHLLIDIDDLARCSTLHRPASHTSTRHGHIHSPRRPLHTEANSHHHLLPSLQ